ncbi:hypothetical protein HETIRDRAFT_381701 [Heterobasidion irregulare TC 32-1]|uniref:Uncharacterized protein n=1 Tax=Heterobasidion irregulare (strain TC 32-1) TaxID=747525 RepID=W4KES9_HETIT|nr:uncharacterized protein HETIRDRAFT_381701 [Heterobasidion irregulare TC 32-1]ETW84249.1 hypothetical protein HETIRDRAFT_381701 [Heterobasidion irregulare TC 32-1]
MAPHSPRRHRLPQHRDFILIPKPLDLSLSDVSEKSPLPAIIVTPSSPSSSGDFSIAFLAPPKASLRERVTSFTAPKQLKARTTLILLLLFFILACHLLTHRLATHNPHLEFNTMNDVSFHTDAEQTPVSTASLFASWFDWKLLGLSVPDGKREFVVTEPVVS